MEDQTIFSPEDFDSCRIYNREESQAIESQKSRDVLMCCEGLLLVKMSDPYQIIRSILAQHYYMYKMDISAVKEDRIGLQQRIP